MTGSETVPEIPALIATPGLQQLLDRFAQEHLLRFEDRVANLFEFLTSNTIRSSDENFLGEEDLTGFIAEVLELPFLTNVHITAAPTLFARCQALGFQREQNGHVPVMTQGPGILLAHYDPHVPLPAGFHKENLQLVLCTWSAFQKLAEAWDERYAGPSGEAYSAPAEPPPSAPREWAEWQIAHNALTEEDGQVLAKIKATDSFDDVPPEWEYWFSRKRKGESCIGLDIVDLPQESKRVGAATLKAVEAVILFENHRLMQLGYVLNWDRFNSVETVAEQIRRQGLVVQLIPVLPRDFSVYSI